MAIADPPEPRPRPRGFTVESDGYGHYLLRRPVWPKLVWLAGMLTLLLTARTLLL